MFDLLTVLLLAFALTAIHDYALAQVFKDSPKASQKGEI